jgi:hypothetical protein
MSFTLTKKSSGSGGELAMQLPKSNDTVAVHACLLQSPKMDSLIGPINQVLEISSKHLDQLGVQHAADLVKRVVLREGFKTAKEAQAFALRGKVPLSNPTRWERPIVDGLRQQSECSDTGNGGSDCGFSAQQSARVVLINIMTNGPGSQAHRHVLDNIVNALQGIPDVAGVVQSIHTKQSLALPAERADCLHGQDHVFEAIGHVIFKVSALSFLQVNSQQCISLYAAVSQAAKLRKHEKVLDLYCGAGTIALWLACEASSVLGIERCRAAVADARSNAVLNGINNVRFEWGDLECLGTKEGILEGQASDVIVVDPPRAGLSAEVMRFLSCCSARRIVYVSCWPASLCRDTEGLQMCGWHCVSVSGVDMFPQTDHMETVAAYERK